MPRSKRISEFKPTLTKVAQTSHYEVMFGGFSTTLLNHLQKRGVDRSFITREAGLLCYQAFLPGTTLGTADIAGNRMGVMEKMVHTRIFTDLQLEFYVDNDYKMMKFFEHWMEYAASGSEESQLHNAYYYRMRFPSEYKCDETKIIKFDRNYKQEIEYTFRKMFPINLSSIPVSYDSSSVLKVSVSFNYERYIAGRAKSINLKRNNDSNKVNTVPDRSAIPTVESSKVDKSTIPTDQLANIGSGRDGTFGEGTYGSGRPSG